MRRGQERSESVGDGFSKKELLDAAPISAKTFDTIRKAARVRGPGHGGLSWEFSVADLASLIRRAESGSFSERGLPAAQPWRALLADRGIFLDEGYHPRRKRPHDQP